DEIIPLRLGRETVSTIGASRATSPIRAVGAGIALRPLRALRSLRAVGAGIALISLVALRRLRRNTVLDMRQTSRRQGTLRIPITPLLFRVRHDQSSLSGATGKLIRPGKSAFPRNGQPSPDASPEPSSMTLMALLPSTSGNASIVTSY